MCIFIIQICVYMYKYFDLSVYCVIKHQMCIFVHANSAAAVWIESIFATKCTICKLCSSDV